MKTMLKHFQRTDLKKVAAAIIIGLTAGTLSLKRDVPTMQTASTNQIVFDLQRDLGSAD